MSRGKPFHLGWIWAGKNVFYCDQGISNVMLDTVNRKAEYFWRCLFISCALNSDAMARMQKTKPVPVCIRFPKSRLLQVFYSFTYTRFTLPETDVEHFVRDCIHGTGHIVNLLSVLKNHHLVAPHYSLYCYVHHAHVHAHAANYAAKRSWNINAMFAAAQRIG